MARRMAVVLALVAPLAAAAEIRGGTVELGGAARLGFSSSYAREGGGAATRERTMGLQAGAVQYLTTHLGLGAELTLLKQARRVGSVVQPDVTTTAVAPRLVVLLPATAGAALYGEALVGWAELKASGARASGLTWGAGAGVKAFLSRDVSLDVGLRYRGARLGATGGDVHLADLFFGLGLSGYLGAR